MHQYLRDKKSMSMKHSDSKSENLSVEASITARGIIQRMVYCSEIGGPVHASGEQPIGLLVSLLRYRLWSVAKPLVDKITSAGVSPMDWKEVSDAMGQVRKRSSDRPWLTCTTHRAPKSMQKSNV